MQDEAGKAGYGLVLALQVTVPCTRLTLVQSLSAEYPDHPRQMFRLQLSDIQTAVALEGGEQDIRFAVGACAVQDLAQDAQVKSILAPTPKSVDRNRACRRAYLQRFFEVWRSHTAQHASKSRRACNFPQHLLITSSAQFSGHVIVGKQDVIATIHGSFLCASLEIGMLRRALMYVCELRQAKPRALRHSNAPQAEPSMQAFKLQPIVDAAGSILPKRMLRLAATIAASYLCEGVLGEPIRDPDFIKICTIDGQPISGRQCHMNMSISTWDIRRAASALALQTARNKLQVINAD
ncbi:hypothetical protein ABBQ32_005486 [Trebouxia sp. C0010 RCD-2024]